MVGEVADGTSAVACAEELKPHLALLDGGPAVVLVSSRSRAELEPLVPARGARGFVPKDELSREAIEELL